MPSLRSWLSRWSCAPAARRPRRLTVLSLEDRVTPVGELLHTLPAPAGAAYAGTSVAASTQYVVVGANGTNVSGLANAGSAAIYDANSGALLWNLPDPSVSGGNGDYFGQSAAVSGNDVLVGAPWYQPTTGQPIGQAYLFDATTGQLVHTLANPEPDPTSWADTGTPEFFGDAVAVIGNTAFVSADYDPRQGGAHTGAVFMFDVTTGNYLGKITPPGGLVGITFGAALASSGSLLAVTAPLAGASAQGQVFVYDTAVSLTTPQWTVDEPTPPAQGSLDDFGRSVALQGSTLVVGAPRRDIGANTDVGMAYVFNLPTGGAATLQQAIDNPHPDNAAEFFGQGVGLSNNAVIVGTPSDDTNGQFNGQAYIFNATTGALLANAANPVTNGSANFGWSAAAAGDKLVVGANLWGTAYIFQGLAATPPAAINDSFHVNEDSSATTLDVLANDTSLDPATLVVATVSQPSHGAVSIAADGKTVKYTPTAGYTGSDSFTYTGVDSGGTSGSATVTITVDPVNHPPTAVVDTASMVEDSGTFTVDVLANDSTAPDTGETLTVQSVTTPGHGTAAVAADGLSVTYTPDPDFAGTDTFYYVVSDGHGGTASAPVVVTVAEDVADRLEVVTSPGAVDFLEKRDASLPLDAAVRIGPAAGGVVTKAVLKFATGYVKGRDALAFTAQGGIKGAFSAATGTLTFTGKASQATYQAALRTVQYVNRSLDPVSGPRTVAITLYDSAGAGQPGYRQVHVTAVDDRPVVTLPQTAVAARVGNPAAVLAGLKISDVDSAFLMGATVTIGNMQAGDTLAAVTTGTGITATFANGVLTLSGSASLTTYLKVLKSVTFTATGGAGVVRSLSVTVDDGELTSDPVSRSVTVG